MAAPATKEPTRAEEALTEEAAPVALFEAEAAAAPIPEVTELAPAEAADFTDVTMAPAELVASSAFDEAARVAAAAVVAAAEGLEAAEADPAPAAPEEEEHWVVEPAWTVTWLE